MMVTSFHAAKKIIQLSNETVTNLKLQKILYLANMVYLSQYSEPLITGESFEAWNYGPVLPNVYHKLKIFGARAVQDRFYREDLIKDIPEADLLEKAWEALSTKEGWELVGITHRPGGAWSKNFEPGLNRKISNQDIKQEYESYGR